MSLVGSSDPKSAALFKKRTLALKKKALELATLCAVPVAVVAALPGGTAPDVWESEEGVLDRYRDLPAEKRAEHTHARYLKDQLDKVTAKLTKLQENGPLALAPPDSMLSRMTLEELRVLLESVDAAVHATDKRKEALGLPHEDVESRGRDVPCTELAMGLEDHQMHRPANTVIDESLQPARNAHHIAGNYPQQNQMPGNGNDHQMIPDPGMTQPARNAQYIEDIKLWLLDEAVEPRGYDVPYIAGNYPRQNQMPGNGNNHHGFLTSAAPYQQPNATMQPLDFGSLGMEVYQMPPQGNDYADDGYHISSREDWRIEAPRNDVAEQAEHPYMDMSSNHVFTPAPYAAQVNGTNFTNTPAAAAAFWNMGTGGNVDDSRGTQSSPNEYVWTSRS